MMSCQTLALVLKIIKSKENKNKMKKKIKRNLGPNFISLTMLYNIIFLESFILFSYDT